MFAWPMSTPLASFIALEKKDHGTVAQKEKRT